MKKILILTFIVMMTGATAAQEAGIRSGNTNYAGLRYYGGSMQIISNFELTYEHLFASNLGIGASFRGDNFVQSLSLTCSYHYNFWKGLGVVGGVGLGCTHFSNSSLYSEEDPLLSNILGIGLQLELGAEYDFEKIPLRLSASLHGSRGMYARSLNVVPSIGVAFRF